MTTTRDRILDAAEQVMRSDGVARTTTRKIAAAAGYSEATIYKHFTSKEDVFVAVLGERLPSFVTLMTAAGQRAGSHPIRETLIEIVAAGLAFYEASLPIAGSVLAEPDLLARHSHAVREQGAGPQKPLDALAMFLRREQRAGSIDPDADPDATAALLLGACFQRAFLNRFAGDAPMTPEARLAEATALVSTLWGGLEPDQRQLAG